MLYRTAAQRSIGNCLDEIICIDPRECGVSHLLYHTAYSRIGKPLTLSCASALKNKLRPMDTVFLLTGFVLPCGRAETDGMCGAVALAQGLSDLLQIRPVFMIPDECERALNAMYRAICFQSPTYVVFPKSQLHAEQIIPKLLQQHHPAAVISIEAPGANKKGICHNAAGMDVTQLEARSDILFQNLRATGVLNIAIGDLGNEIGMGTIGRVNRRYIPFGKRCRCRCGGGIIAKTEAGLTLVATTSDWGAYGLLAALSYLCDTPSASPSASLVRTLIQTAVQNGLVNMDGRPAEQVDGFCIGLNCAIAECLRHCVLYAKQKNNGTHPSRWCL